MVVEIPEGVEIEKGTVEKIVELSKDNKAVNFIKSLIGIKEEDITKADLKPEEIKALNTACKEGDIKACGQLKAAGITKEEIEEIIEKEEKEGDVTIKKDEDIKKQMNTIIKKNDELEQTVYNQGKLIKEQGETIESLKDITEKAQEKVQKEVHKNLVKDALDSYKLLKEEVADEDALKEKLIKEEGYTEDQIKKDIDTPLREVIKANTKAASKIKQHPGPDLTNPITKEQNDIYKKRVEEMKKQVENIGVITPLEE